MILVTGGAGYIGSHTVLNLLEYNKDIVIFDNLENGHIETVNILSTLGNVVFEKGDLRNILDIEKIFNKYNIAILKIFGYNHTSIKHVGGVKFENKCIYNG